MTDVVSKTWDELTIEDFPRRGTDKVRFSDIDIVGHVNNLAFMAYLETGRVDLLYNMDMQQLTPDASFVLVQKNTYFRKEMKWPGYVDVGTAIAKLGGSSVTLIQALFQEGVCSSSAESVLVLIDVKTRKPTSIPDKARQYLEQDMAKFILQN